MSVYRMNTKEWSVERAMFLLGGFLVVSFSFLSLFLRQDFAWGAVGVGVLLGVFAVTGYCPGAIIAAKIMKK